MLEQLSRSWTAVFTQPSVATFDQERAQASLAPAVVGVLLAGVVTGIVSAIGQFIGFSIIPSMFMDEANPEFGAMMEPLQGMLVLAGLFVTPICAVLGFFLWSGVTFLVAKMLGGPGDYVVHAYLISLVQAPVGIIRGVVSIIPCLGALISIGVFIFSLFLTTLAMQSAHGFTTGRAVAVWLIPMAVIMFIGFCLAAAAIGVAIVAMGMGG